MSVFFVSHVNLVEELSYSLIDWLGDCGCR